MAARHLKIIIQNIIFSLVQGEYSLFWMVWYTQNLSLGCNKALKMAKNWFYFIFVSPQLKAPLWAHDFFEKFNIFEGILSENEKKTMWLLGRNYL